MVNTATDTAGYRPPPRREQLHAVLLAALCSVLFLGEALLPGHAVMPFAPEVLEPLRTEALESGRVTLADLTVGNPSGGDKYNQSLAWDRITHDRLSAGDWPLWTRDISGGAPFVPQMGQIYQPWSWLLPLVPSPGVYGLWYLLHQVLFAFFGYRFLRRIGVQHASGLLGVVCLAVGLWTQARVHHNVILSAALPLFAMLSCVHQIGVYRGGARAAGWLALGMGVSWLGGMPQLSLMITYLVAGYGLLLVWGRGRGERLQPLLWMGVALGVGSLVACGQVLPVLVAAQDTARGVPTAADLASRSLEWDHLLAAVWPDLLSWPAQHWYPEPLAPESNRQPWAALLLLDWGRITAGFYNYQETAFAVGLPALVLALCALGSRVKRREVWFFAAAGALGFLMATTTEPLLSLSAVAPGARSGDPKRFVFLCAMALSVLAALGMDRLSEARVPRSAVVVAALLALASAVLLVVHAGTAQELEAIYSSWVTADHAGVTPESFREVVAVGEAEANRSRLFATFARALVCAGLVLLLLRWRRATWALLGLVALTAVDLLMAGRGTIVAVETERVTTPPRILEPALRATREATSARPRFQRLTTNPKDLRPGSLLRPNLGAFYGLEDLASYNPLPPKRMEELFSVLEPGMQLLGNGVDRFKRLDSLTHPLVDELGIEWLLVDGPIQVPGYEDHTPADYPHRFRLYRRTTCLPRATFVTRARVVENRELRLGILGTHDRDPLREVLLEDPTAPALERRAAKTEAEVAITRHEDEQVDVTVRCAAPGYLRLADPWDPGWTATVDGEDAVVYVADHYLRAVYLEPGEHVVSFRYTGNVATWPRRLSALGLLLVFCLVLVRRRG